MRANQVNSLSVLSYLLVICVSTKQIDGDVDRSSIKDGFKGICRVLSLPWVLVSCLEYGRYKLNVYIIENCTYILIINTMLYNHRGPTGELSLHREKTTLSRKHLLIFCF